MGKLNKSDTRPKRCWEITVDGRNIESAEELLEWVRLNAKGHTTYTVTMFRDPAVQSKGWSSRYQRHNFGDEYPVYTLWFASKTDAALCRLFWEPMRFA